MGQRPGRQDIAVLGGGIAGLTCAYRLAQEGQRVTVFEAEDRLGGLGTWFEHDGEKLERYYHVMIDSDSHLLQLLHELGLGPRIVWSETGMGFMVRGRRYPFNTALDLLQFRALSMLDRVRTGAGALYITRGVRDGLALDDVLAVEWLPKVFGQRVFKRIWDPLLAAKFGDHRHEVPAYWVWNLLTREKNGSQEVKGYVVGGYDVVSEALRTRIEALGGTVRTGVPVQSVAADGWGGDVRTPDGMRRFDAVVSTLPIPLLRQLADGPVAEQVPVADLRYQGVVNAVYVLKRRLMPHYWTAVVDSDFAFQGVVETTHVRPPESIGGRHLVYALNYCGPEHPLYQADDGEVLRLASDGMARLFGFRPGEEEGAYVFRTPHVEPVWTRGYLARRPKPQVGDSKLYLCTTAQAYPMITAWNTSVKLATEVTNTMRGELT